MREFFLITLALTVLSTRAFACAACQDRDVFKNSFVANTNSAAEAAAAASAAAGPAAAVAQPTAPRERGIVGGPSSPAVGDSEIASRKPSLHIRSMNELR